MKQGLFLIDRNIRIAENTYLIELSGDASALHKPGQFVNIKLDGFFLRRPISVCDYDKEHITLIYKTVGAGTELMSRLSAGKELDLLTGLGNGFDTVQSGARPLLVAGGGGVPPMLNLAKTLAKEGKTVTAVLGFNRASEVFLEEELLKAGADVIVTTADGSRGMKGFVTDAVKTLDYTYFFTCGPKPMYNALRRAVKTEGQYSFEERMGCGFGACMGCSIKTKGGSRRVCKDGPVFRSEEILWEEL